MKTIELVITACSILHGGGECREFVNTYDATKVSFWMCTMQAQPQLAKWQVTHPNWKVARYTCRVPVQGWAKT